MIASEFTFTLAMLNISIVSFIWIMKQVILLGYWFCKREIGRLENNE